MVRLGVVIRPRFQYQTDADDGECLLAFAQLPAGSPDGVDWMFGVAMMRPYCTLYDAGASPRVGFTKSVAPAS